MNYQYADYFAYLRTVLQGQNSFRYTLSRGLGGDLLSLWAYYLASPFDLIPAVFPDESMPLAVSIEMLLLFGSSGLSCYYALRRFVPEGGAITLLYFSLAYSLSGWMLLNAENFQFVTAAAALPMAAAAVGEMKQTGKIMKAVLWLTLTALVNFYIGYMIWIFSFLWLVIPDEKKIRPKMLLIFAIACIICLPVFIPVMERLRVSVKEPESLWYVPAWNCSLPELLKKFLPGQFNVSQYLDKGLPAVYCGLIALICVLVRIFQKDRMALKRHRFILLAVLFFSLIFRPLTMIWQGFSAPHWWPYRFSFLLIFMLLLTAAETRIRIPWYILIIGAGGLFFNMEKTLPVKLANAVPADRYAAAVSEKRRLIETIKAEDPDVYRIDDLTPRSDNDPMHFSYYGITNFESMAPADVMDFLGRMGFPIDRYTVSYGLGNTAFANAVLGVRYVLDGEKIIPFGYPVGPAFIKDGTVLADPGPADDPFEFQNAIAKSLGTEKDILYRVTADEALYYNTECTDQFCWSIDPDEPAQIVFRISSDRDVNLYAYSNSPLVIGSMAFKADGKLIELNSPDYFLPLGKIAAGETAEIELEAADSLFDIPENEIGFIAEDAGMVARLAEKLYGGIEIENQSDADLRVSFPKSAVPRILIVTVPYERRWQAFSGKEKLAAMPWADTFLAVSIPADTSEVQFRYR